MFSFTSAMPTAIVKTLRNQTPPSPILHLSFNQDGDCFSVGTTDGYAAFQTDPFAKTLRSNFPKFVSGAGAGAGIGIVEMLFRTNRLALVGGGAAPKFPRNRVMIWDDRLRRCIGELVFRSEVRSVRLSRDRVVVVTLQKIFVYNFEDLRLLHEIVTESNPKGLCEISKKGFLVLASLGLRQGQVSVNHYARSRENLIMAHNSTIGCLALSDDGKILATASVKGTLIRVFNSLDGSLLHELRRGVERAEIYSLRFSSNFEWLAVSSDRGTIHVFSIKIDLRSLNMTGLRRVEYQDLSPAPDSRISLIKGMLPKYFSSEWSLAQFRVKEGVQHIINFGKQENTLDIVGFDGRFYRCQFDPVVGGMMNQLERHNFIPQELK